MRDDKVTPIPKGSTKKPKKRKVKRKGPTPMVACDILFGQIIRSRGACESGRDNHKGVLQCAHGFSRRYRATRWMEEQCWCLCAGCHMFFTQRPLEWDQWMRERLGGPFYESIRHEALFGPNPNLKETAERLRRRLDVIEGRAAA